MAKSKHRNTNSSISNGAYGRLMVIDATVSNGGLNGREKRHIIVPLKRKKSNAGRIVKSKMCKVTKRRKIRLCNLEQYDSAAPENNSEASGNDDYPSFLKKINISSNDDMEYENAQSNNIPGEFSQDLPISCQKRFFRTHEETSNSENVSANNEDELTDAPGTSLWNHEDMNISSILNLNSSDSEASYDKSEQSVVLQSDDSSLYEISEISGQNVRVLPDPQWNLEVVILEHPSAILLYNYINVKVISGCVSVHGYQINSDSPPFPVFSSEWSGLIKLTTEYPEEIWKRKGLYPAAKFNLEQYICEKKAQKILSLCGNCSVIVVLQKIPFPSTIQFLQLYYPFEVKFRQHPIMGRGFCFKKNISGALKFDSECDSLAEDIALAIRKSEVKFRAGQRIVVYGPQNSGKSALLRYLINKVLFTFSEVYYLDTDPGQTEFTPPGVVSIIKVTRPLLGPPFTHQKDPVKMIFTGSHSVETSPHMHSRSVYQLMEFFNSNSTESLFVNTMGWMHGYGLQSLCEVMKAVKPTIMVEIVDENKPLEFNHEEFLDRHGKHYKIQVQKTRDNKKYLPGPMMRNFSIMSYFGRCQMSLLPPMHLNTFQPVCVSWDKIAVYVFGKKLPPHRIIEAINASFVALCTVDESLVLESDIPDFQRTLQDEPANECLAFGLVRAVDEEKHFLYIVTPLPLTQLCKVNAIMKGDIVVPDAIYREQPIYHRPIPFTDKSRGIFSDSRKIIPKRMRRKKKG